MIPDENLINYKEAIVFGLMAILKDQGQDNVLSTVTGAYENTSSGILYTP